MAIKETYGVFPHAEWINGEVRLTKNGGHVVRPIGNYVPYGRMTPVKIYQRKADAERLADKLTFGPARENPLIAGIFGRSTKRAGWTQGR